MIIRPSGAHRWVKCGDAVYPPPESGPPNDAAVFGTECHDIAAALLSGTDSKFEPTAEHMAVVTPYVNYVTAQQAYVRIEQYVELKHLHPRLAGTPDAIWEGGVIDLKTGRTYVDPYENWQLICYASSMIDEVEPDAPFELVIFQGGAPKTWKLENYAQLYPYFEIIKAALATERPAQAGSHCLYCRKAATCEALAATVGQIIEFTRTVDPFGGNIGLELLESERAMEILSIRLNVLKARAESMIRDGKSVINYTLKPGKSSRRLIEPEILAALIGRDVVYEEAPRSPAQIEKLDLNEEQRAILKQYTDKVPGALKLIQIDIKKELNK